MTSCDFGAIYKCSNYLHTYIHTYIHAFLLTDLDIFLNRIYGAVKTIAISINIEDTNQLACIKQAV